MTFAHLRSFVLPLTMGVVVPILVSNGEVRATAPPAQRILGAALLLGGLAMLVWTVGLFARVGKGTLAPWTVRPRLRFRGEPVIDHLHHQCGGEI
jgi:hypothetical protein